MAALFWVGGTGTYDGTTNHFATTSGGVASVAAPTSSDTVTFDTLSNATAYTVTISATLNCSDLTIGNPLVGAITFAGSSAINCYGNFSAPSGGTWTYSGTLSFTSTSTGKTITTNGVSFPGTMTYNGSGGDWTLQDNLTLTFVLSVYVGTLNSNNKTISCAAFVIYGTFNAGSSTINMSIGGTGSFINAGTFNASTSTINCGSGINQFTGGNGSYYNVNFTNSTITISGSNSFNVLSIASGITATFTAGTTQTFTLSPTLTGSNGSPITLKSSASGSTFTLSQSTGTVSASHVIIKDSVATGGATWNAAYSVDGGNNSGWSITQVPVGSITPILGSTTANPSASATRYYWPAANNITTAWNASEGTCEQTISDYGVLKNLSITVASAPGASKSYAFTIMKNGSATSLTTTISGTNVTNSDTSDLIYVLPGDVISLRSVPSGTPGATGNIKWSFGWQSTISTGQSIIIAGSSGALSASAARYNGIQSSSAWNATATSTRQVMPTAGVIKNLFIALSAAPGTAGGGQSYQFDVYKNGLVASPSLSCTISETATTGSDTTHSITYAAGDTIEIAATPTNTPGAIAAHWGVSFIPTVSGESLLLAGTSAVVTATAASYLGLGGISTSAPSATETDNTQIMPSFMVKKLQVLIDGSPGGTGKSYTFTVRKNSADTSPAITTTLSNTTTTGSDTSDTSVFSAGDTIDVSITPSTPTNPTARRVFVGLVLYPLTQQTITGLARLTTTTTKTETGVANISSAGTTTNQTETGKAKITVTTTKTVTGISRIKVTTNKTETGISRVSITTQKTEAGISRVSVSTNKTITGISKITATTNRTVAGKARITSVTNQTVTGKAKLYITTNKTETGVSRVQITTNRTSTGVSRVTINTNQTIAGKSRITVVSNKTETGISRIKATTTKTETGVSRVSVTTNQTITGKSSLYITTNQTETGKAKITVTTTKTVTGKANVLAATNKTITGKSSILSTTNKTITGLSKVSVITRKTVTGVSNIIPVPTWFDQTIGTSMLGYRELAGDLIPYWPAPVKPNNYKPEKIVVSITQESLVPSTKLEGINANVDGDDRVHYSSETLSGTIDQAIGSSSIGTRELGGQVINEYTENPPQIRPVGKKIIPNYTPENINSGMLVDEKPIAGIQ